MTLPIFTQMIVKQYARYEYQLENNKDYKPLKDYHTLVCDIKDFLYKWDFVMINREFGLKLAHQVSDFIFECKLNFVRKVLVFKNENFLSLNPDEIVIQDFIINCKNWSELLKSIKEL